MTQGARARVFLFLGFGVFLAVLAYAIASSLTRRSARVFAPSPVAVPLGTGAGPDTITVVAHDQQDWQYLDLDRAMILSAGDSAGWDLAVRRFHIRTADPPGDLGKWYTYGMLSHLLESAGEQYAVRTSRGRTASIEVLGYYCPGLEAGCVTLRSQLEPDHPPTP
jgi:hypothetical protein